MRVTDSVVDANKAHGIVVFQGASDVTLSGNEVHDNKLSGIDVDGSLRLRLSGNVVYGNGVGLHVQGRSRSVGVDGNRLTATGSTACGSRAAPGRSRPPGT
jgi:parallel beta-helix repeat protein